MDFTVPHLRPDKQPRATFSLKHNFDPNGYPYVIQYAAGINAMTMLSFIFVIYKFYIKKFEIIYNYINILIYYCKI